LAQPQNALQATRAALEEGVVAGGGVALINAMKALDTLKADNDEEQVGVKILRSALEAPFRQILANAGFEAAAYISQVTGTMGFDARAGKMTDMIKDGIIDPVKVTRSALENAASVAMLLLTTEAVVTEVPKAEDSSPSMGGAGGMGGMGMM